MNNIGIVGFGIYLPETYETAQNIAEKSNVPLDIIINKFGINKKTIPGPDDGTMEMGVKAAKDCLRRTEEKAENIDVIICIGEEYKEYPLVTSGIYIQEKIGAYNAWAFDIALRCGTAVAAMKLAKALMLEDGNVNTILIVGGCRNGDLIDYKNPRVSFMYNLAAGAGAILLKKDYNKNILLETEIITDGAFSEDVVVRYGGTKNPINSKNAEIATKSLDVTSPERMKKGLGEKSMENFIKVIKKSLKKSNLQTKDIDYLAILHMKKSAHDFVLEELGIDESKTTYLNDYGHIGQIDQILSTIIALEQGKIKEGSIVVWVSAGIGYAWDACTIRWGQ
ncbi:MAG: 3-oxoacyl-ACP synthase [Clostridiales bacterium]|nr:3-oxoacyl-ACP synthase [Clostridiales bacterium]